MRLTSNSVEETLALGAAIGRLANPGACIALDGQLGAGKTHLTRGIARGAGVEDESLVASPTYVLLNVYRAGSHGMGGGQGKTVYHLDAYRVSGPEDFAAAGFDEWLNSGGIVVVEWAEKVRELLPADRLHIRIDHDGEATEQRRDLEIHATGPASTMLMEKIAREWAAQTRPRSS